MTVVFIAYLVIELLMNRLTVEADFWRKELHRFWGFFYPRCSSPGHSAPDRQRRRFQATD